MKTFLAVVAAALFLLPVAHAQEAEREGTVVDGTTERPLAGVTVTVGDKAVLTDAQGKFKVAGGSEPIKVRLSGYRRETIAPADAGQNPQTVKLTPLLPKALYLTVYGIGAPFLLDPALDVIERSKLNALVIDIKGDRGLIPYPSALPLATKIGAQKLRTIPDLKALVSTLKAKNLYLIARIVTFKDTLLATAHPEWAVHGAGGALWKDREGLAWIDPFQKAAWDYPISVAEEAAAAGFDEVQFDYIRFPDAGGMGYSEASTETSRVAAITGFLREAKRRLAPYNVFLAMDSFGYVCWNENDTGIGQTNRGPGVGGGRHLAHALSLGLPVRHSRLPQSGPEPVRNRLQVAGRVQTPDGQPAGALQALAAGIYRLCLRRKGLRRRGDRQADQGIARCRHGRMDAVEPTQCLHDQ